MIDASLASPSSGELRAAFDAQRRRYRAQPYPPISGRRARLDALERVIRARRKDVAAALAADFGKPAEETELTEIIPALHELRHARRSLAQWAKAQKVATPLKLLGASSEVRYEPKGVVLILAPWNYPFYLAIVPLIAALAAGNRVILRPAEKTPHTTAVIGAIVREAFAPEDVTFFGGDVEVAQSLLELPFDHIFFTGSTRVGKIVMRAAAQNLSSVTLELGGKSPAFVAEGADPKLAGERIAWGKFINAGQTCVAPDYVLVHESQAAAFIGEAVAAVERMYGKSESERGANADFCRLIDDAAFERIVRLLDASVAAGARIVIGGQRDRARRYLAPTILSGVGFDAPIMSEEIFGPVLPVLTYRSLDDALAQVNLRPKPLALYAFGAPGETRTIVERTSSGGVAIDDVVIHLANEHLPFGGAGESGQGNYHGVFGFRAFSHERTVFRQAKRSALALLYPPYGRKARLMLGALDRMP
jgi:aldehyde dehydrogenase (NAD+)